MKNALEWIAGWHAATSVMRYRGHDVVEVVLQQGRQDERAEQVLQWASAKGVTVTRAERQWMDAQVSTRHQGVLLHCTPAAEKDEAWFGNWLEQADNPFILVLDGITDPHNFGACLRSADAAGVDVVVAPKDKSARLNDTVRKVACGAVETLPVVFVTNLARALGEMKQAGVWLTGAAGEAEQSLYEMDLRGALALVMGAEGKGLRRLTREHCDHLAKLPMAGSVSSLNVSVATGVCLFEAVRQRRA